MGGAACSDGGGAGEVPWLGTIDTVEGGAVRVVSPDDPSSDPNARPRLVEARRVEGPFGSVPDIAPAGDGGVWVLDGEAREVIRIDAAGREVRRFGGPGEAPDRFQYPRRLHRRGDTLWVEDLGLARWSAWTVDGAALGVFDLPSGVAGGNADWTASGLVGIERRRTDDDEVVRWAGRWLPADGGFRRVDSLPAPPVPDPVALQATFTRQGRPVSLAFPLPLAHQPAAVPEPDGTGWVVTPGGGDYRILRVALDGTVRREIVRAFAPVPVPDAERAAAVERLPAELRDEQADRVPRTWPPFDRVVVGSDGRLWVVRRGAGGRPALDLFDAEGRYRGEVVVDLDLRGFWVHEADAEGVWGVQRDAEGRPVVLRLTHPR